MGGSCTSAEKQTQPVRQGPQVHASELEGASFGINVEVAGILTQQQVRAGEVQQAHWRPELKLLVNADDCAAQNKALRGRCTRCRGTTYLQYCVPRLDCAGATPESNGASVQR